MVDMLFPSCFPQSKVFFSSKAEVPMQPVQSKSRSQEVSAKSLDFDLFFLSKALLLPGPSKGCRMEAYR